jgi:hypothetical protein
MSTTFLIVGLSLMFLLGLVVGWLVGELHRGPRP